MTTYRQNVPEMIWVSQEVYTGVLTTLDPFARNGFIHTPVWDRELGPTGNVISMMIDASEPAGTEDELEQARR